MNRLVAGRTIKPLLVEARRRAANDVRKRVSQPGKTAREIAEDLLDRSGRGLTEGDFDLFERCFALPNEMETFEGRRVIETREEMRAVFDDVRAYYDRIGRTRVDRFIVDAEFRNSTCIVSTHQSHVYAGEDLAQQPFDVLSVIELQDGVWRIRHSEYAITDSKDHSNALVGAGATLAGGSGP